LTDEQKGILFDLLVDYIKGYTNIDKISDQEVRVSFRFITARVKRIIERYEKRREINRENASKRWQKKEE
jgi:hypothetical protein